MATTISALLNEQQLAIADLASQSGIDQAALAKAVEKPVATWSIAVLNAFAQGLGMQASDLLNQLQPNDYKLQIDDQKQIIQGLHISDYKLYQQVKFAVVNDHLEGWQPKREDVQYLLAEIQRPDPEFDERYKELFENE